MCNGIYISVDLHPIKIIHYILLYSKYDRFVTWIYCLFNQRFKTWNLLYKIYYKIYPKMQVINNIDKKNILSE